MWLFIKKTHFVLLLTCNLLFQYRYDFLIIGYFSPPRTNLIINYMYLIWYVIYYFSIYIYIYYICFSKNIKIQILKRKFNYSSKFKVVSELVKSVMNYLLLVKLVVSIPLVFCLSYYIIWLFENVYTKLRTWGHR